MSWNIRLLAHINDEEDVYFQIHEVYYDNENKPNAYTKEAVTIGGEDIKAIKWYLKQVNKALEKPILIAGEKFPQEYKIIKL